MPESIQFDGQLVPVMLSDVRESILGYAANLRRENDWIIGDVTITSDFDLDLFVPTVCLTQVTFTDGMHKTINHGFLKAIIYVPEPSFSTMKEDSNGS